MRNVISRSRSLVLLMFAVGALGVPVPGMADFTEPVAPVSNQQCEQLSRDAIQARIVISNRASQCVRASSDRKWGVIGDQGCANWVPQECVGIVRECEALQSRAEAALERCRDTVAALRDKAREEAKEHAINSADHIVGGGVRDAADAVTSIQRTRDNLNTALNFFSGKQTAAAQYQTVSDAARAAQGHAGGNPIAREFFDRSLTEINAVHLAALAQLDAAIAATVGIKFTPPVPAPRLAATPDPALRAREEALRANFAANQQRLEQQQLAMVREREATEARERAARAAERQRESEGKMAAAKRADRERVRERRLDAMERELAYERENARNQQAQRNQQSIINAVTGAVLGIQSIQRNVDSYRASQQENTYSNPSYGGSSGNGSGYGGGYGSDDCRYLNSLPSTGRGDRVVCE